MQNLENGTGNPGALLDLRETGTALLKQGKFDEAAAVLREAVAQDSNDEVAWRLLGGALASKGDAAGAIAAFQNSVRILPMAARSHYNLGLAYQSAGRLAEARASLERALSLDPGHDQARTRLGEVSEQMGQRTTPVASALVSAEGHTNIGGGGNPSSLSVLSSPSYQPQNQSQSSGTEGHSNISGGGNAASLLSIGSHRDVPASTGGHSNISGSNASGLSSVGASASTPQDTGHTNISGGNTAMLGSVGVAGGSVRPATPMSAPPLSASPLSAPASISPSLPAYPSPVLQSSASLMDRNLTNTSGMQGDVPEDLARQFNWGAMLFTWMDIGFIWAFNMRMNMMGGILLAMLVVPWIIGIGSAAISVAAQSSGASYGGYGLSGLIWLARIGLGIYLGINGNKLAWQNRPFASEEDCHSCQRTWTYWAIGMICFNILIAILFGWLIIALIIAAVSQGSHMNHVR